MIQFRGPGSRKPDALARTILSNLAQLAEALEGGSIVTFEPSRVRVRAFADQQNIARRLAASVLSTRPSIFRRRCSMDAASLALRDLIEIGRKNTERIPRSLKDDSAWKAFNDGKDSWIGLASALRPDELEHLIRGLVLYGRASGRFHTGRLSPITWLFRILRMSSPGDEARVGAWVVANRVNPWDPLGVMEGDNSHTLEESKTRERARLRASLDRPREGRDRRIPGRF